VKTDSAAVREVPAHRIAHLSPFRETCRACGVPLVVVVFGPASPYEVLLFSAREGEDMDALSARIRQVMLEAARQGGVMALDADGIS